MVSNIQAAIDSLLNDFPRLREPGNFQQNSAPTAIYNCIAWALGLGDIFVASDNVPWHWWPMGIDRDFSEKALIECFKFFGYEETDDVSVEKFYDKVALYSLGGKWTHAARVIDTDKFHSKFGYNVDGFHKSGDVLASKYGLVYKYMRRPIADRHISTDIRMTLPPPQNYVMAPNGQRYVQYCGSLFLLPPNTIV